MELKDIIEDYKKRHQLNNREVAKRFGVASTTVGRWLSGEVTSLHGATAKRASEILGYDITVALENRMSSLNRPVLGFVKGGYDLWLDNEYLGEENVSVEEYEQGDYFLKVVGNSMIGDGIIDGGLVYVQATPYVQNGSIAVVQVQDEVTIKRIQYKKDGISLIASNKEVPERSYTAREIADLPVRIIGKVLFSKNYFE